jgi:chromosome segregation ATPase
MTIQYIMLVSLGFLIASLITLLMAPIFWKRAVRLTSTRLRQSLPLSEHEILADKDQLRAKYAIRVHQLEKQVETASLGAARQKIDLNRRDAGITQLETEINTLKAEVEENQNARSVLEQTVSDRIPKIEARLDEARKLLLVRDREVAELSQSSRRQQEALNDARVINQKQTSDVERLRSQVLAYEAQTRKSANDGDLEGELAIRTELEVLRARSRDQSSLIDRLNAEISVGRANSETSHGAVAASSQVVPLNGTAAPTDMGVVDAAAAETVAALRHEVAVLRVQLDQAKGANDASADAVKLAANAETPVEQELRAMKAKAEDQATEITRLRTEIAAVTTENNNSEGAIPSLRDNRIALKARVSGLEAKSNQQAETIQRLRAEVAQANERAARQASNFMDEMRRLGMAAHVTQPRTGRPQESAKARNNVTKRTQALFDASHSNGSGWTSSTGEEGTESGVAHKAAAQAAAQGAIPLGRRLSPSPRPIGDRGDEARIEPAAGLQEAAAAVPERVSTLVAALRGNGNGAADQSAARQDGAEAAVSEPTAPRQPRLLDRITSAESKT